MSDRRSRSGRALLAALVVPAVLAGCSGRSQPKASPQAYCQVLNEETAQLDRNVANADDSLGAQLALVLSNIGEFTRLLQRLEDVAPPEIKVDMLQTVKAWDAQQDALKEVARDPLKALISGAVTAVFSSGSTQAVEDYTVKTCGRPLFGSVGGAAPTRCPTVLSTGPFAAASLASDAKAAQLVDALRSVAALSADFRKLSDPLVNQIEVLNPEARFAREAIGRLNFDGKNATATLDAINKAVLTACGSPAFGQDGMAATRDLLPRPEGSAVKISSTMYGTSCTGGGGLLRSGILLALPFAQLFRCDSGMSVVVDLESGSPTWLEPSDGQALTGIRNAGDRMVWIEKRERPAQGLEPVRTSVALRIMPLDGSPVITVPILTDYPQSLGGTRYEVVSAWRDRVVTHEGRPGQEGTDLLVRDGSGREIARIDLQGENIYDDVTDAAGEPYAAAADALLVLSGRDGKSVFLDMQSGKLLRAGARARRVTQTACLDRAIVGADNGDGWQVTVTEGKPTMTPLAPGFAEGRSYESVAAAVARPGLVVDRDSNLNVRARRLDGREVWRIGAEVVKNFKVLGGWVEIENRSGQKVIVDPTTGREAASLPSVVTTALSKLSGEGPDSFLFDSPSNTLIIVRDSQASRFPLDAICPG